MKKYLFAGLLVTTSLSAGEIYRTHPELYAQLSDEEREWFRSQRSPNGGFPCCNEADGEYADESDGCPPDPTVQCGEDGDRHYWAKFVYQKWNNGTLVPIQSGWVKIPDEVVIHNPNRHGQPIVWYNSSTDPVAIRCFLPGAKV